jgi:hypothetical protein
MDTITRGLGGMSLEERATARFCAYRDELVRRLGRGPLDSDEIDRVGRREFGPRWGGVGRQGHRLRPGLFFVVNTAWSMRSPGSHWMAVYSDLGGRHHVYDSFARSGRAMLWKTMRANRWSEVLDSDRSDAEQRAGSLCGHMALAWLLTLRDLGVDAAMTI